MAKLYEYSILRTGNGFISKAVIDGTYVEKDDSRIFYSDGVAYTRVFNEAVLQYNHYRYYSLTEQDEEAVSALAEQLKLSAESELKAFQEQINIVKNKILMANNLSVDSIKTYG